MPAYYNENDPTAAAWLRELIKAGLIAPGDVDERSIKDVSPDDVAGYGQCHFFAGIGGWSCALRLAGIPDDFPVWTGSCPCQPYSAAGKGLGDADPRNLWPDFFRLIEKCRPVRVFGEQVPAAIRHGWLDGISADLEAEGYACGAIVLGAHSVGAPHIRQRLYWVANAHGYRRGETRCGESAAGNDGFIRNRRLGGVGDSIGPPLEGHSGDEFHGGQSGRIDPDAIGSTATTGGAGFWSAFDLIPCRDGKSRRIGPGTFPLAHGVSGRVGLLRGYGNAIVPQVAAEFIKACF